MVVCAAGVYGVSPPLAKRETLDAVLCMEHAESMDAVVETLEILMLLSPRMCPPGSVTSSPNRSAPAFAFFLRWRFFCDLL